MAGRNAQYAPGPLPKFAGRAVPSTLYAGNVFCPQCAVDPTRGAVGNNSALMVE